MKNIATPTMILSHNLSRLILESGPFIPMLSNTCLSKPCSLNKSSFAIVCVVTYSRDFYEVARENVNIVRMLQAEI